jgi:carbonic anhydrase
MTAAPTPADAWTTLREGNQRFVAGTMDHPSQSVQRRAELSAGQRPTAVILGCSDSRVAAEIIFDQGLGDMFVVRTAGQVLDTTVIGSIEYGIGILDIPLVVVLGHDSCGAVAAAVDALETGRMPTGFVRAIVDRVIPALLTRAVLPGEEPIAGGGGLPPADQLRREHVRSTGEMLVDYSSMLRERIEAGTAAVVGVEYTLADGTARLVDAVGEVGEQPLPRYTA